MYLTQALRRPLNARIMQGAAGRYTRLPNKIHSRGIITLKDHLVSAFYAGIRGIADCEPLAH